jgi:hypothetical protein
MADLRARFVEDYAGGLLNVARQELSSTGEVLAQDGFVDNFTLFVEDGRGVKSGLRLGSSLAECVDPTTETGLLNVRTADRTYAKVRDLKTFATALASAQGALSESVADAITNVENAFDSLELSLQSLQNQFTLYSDTTSSQIGGINTNLDSFQGSIDQIDTNLSSITSRVLSLEQIIESNKIKTEENVVNVLTPVLANDAYSDIDISMSKYYALLRANTNTPAWVSIYTSSNARSQDSRTSSSSTSEGVVLDLVTSTGNLVKQLAPALVGYSTSDTVFLRLRNKSGGLSKIGCELRFIPI